MGNGAPCGEVREGKDCLRAAVGTGVRKQCFSADGREKYRGARAFHWLKQTRSQLAMEPGKGSVKGSMERGSRSR